MEKRAIDLISYPVNTNFTTHSNAIVNFRFNYQNSSSFSPETHCLQAPISVDNKKKTMSVNRSDNLKLPTTHVKHDDEIILIRLHALSYILTSFVILTSLCNSYLPFTILTSLCIFVSVFHYLLEHYAKYPYKTK